MLFGFIVVVIVKEEKKLIEGEVTMKKLLSLLLGLCVLTATLGGTAYASAPVTTADTYAQTAADTVWTVDNILKRTTEKEDVLFGSWVTFADTKVGLSALDQIERYYFGGINYMPMACTIPSQGILTAEDKKTMKRDMTSSLWWEKVDEVMQEYNMVYLWSTLSGLANDYEPVSRRSNMINDNALSDARNIIPLLDNCIGVHIADEPHYDSFDTYANWAKKYAAIEDLYGENMGLYSIVNHLPYYGWDSTMQTWVNKAGTATGVISYDNYGFAPGTDARDALIGGANNMRKVANANDMRFQSMPQSCAWNGRYMPNLNELKWNTTMYLAYGSTMFAYFNYMMYPNEGSFDGIFAMDGTMLHQDIYDGMSDLHKKIRVIDANIRYSKLEATEVYKVGSHAGDTATLPSSDWLVKNSGLSGNELVFTRFTQRSGSGDEYLMVFNNNPYAAVKNEQLIINATKVNGLEVMNVETGLWERVAIINGAVSLDLAKSDFNVYRVNAA